MEFYRFNPIIRVRVIVVIVFFLIALAFGECAAPVFAEAVAPWWHINVGSRPTRLAPGREGTIVVSATNFGDGEVNEGGGTVTVTDRLPVGVEATKALYVAGLDGEDGHETCSVPTAAMVVCAFSGVLPPYQRLEVRIYVRMKEPLAAGKLTDGVNISGGDAPSISVNGSLTVGEGPEPQTPFGVESLELFPENSDGSPDAQAGSHPFQFTTTLVLNAGEETEGFSLGGQLGEVTQPALPRNLRFDLPPGLVGNASPFPQCTEGQFNVEKCPVGSQLGVAVVTVGNPRFTTIVRPLFNMVPTVFRCSWIPPFVLVGIMV
jgi:hypothetical protein